MISNSILRRLPNRLAGLTALALCSCANGDGIDGGRWHHYSVGGSFIGARPSFAPDCKSIVYASARSGHGDIYRVESDGTNVVRLTNRDEYEGDPVYAPDGKKIAFVREYQGKGHIWIMNADGSGQKQVTNGPDYDSSPSFSPDGSKILFARELAIGVREHPAELFLVNSDGTGTRRITNDTQADWPGAFSPKGDTILYSVRSREVWLMDRDGSNRRRIGAGALPAFSHDGKRIVVQAGTYGRELNIMNSDGSNVKVIYRSQKYISYPSFIPSGESILFLEEDEEPRGAGTIKRLTISDASVNDITSTR